MLKYLIIYNNKIKQYLIPKQFNNKNPKIRYNKIGINLVPINRQK